MARIFALSVAASLLAAAAASSSAAATTGSSPIKTIVVLMMENRAFDHVSICIFVASVAKMPWSISSRASY
jgi:hypothetical protein